MGIYKGRMRGRETRYKRGVSRVLITSVLRFLGGATILQPQGRLLFILIVPVAVFLGVERNYFPFSFDFYAMGEEFT